MTVASEIDQPAALDESVRITFRDQLRAARASALRNSEGFREIFFCLERLAAYLNVPEDGLLKACDKTEQLARNSPLAVSIPEEFRELHPTFRALYQRVVHSRNRAAHEGAFARNLTRHAVELTLILEDALQRGMMEVQHFMVRDPVVANDWEPISFVRQKMLLNAFSFLPAEVTKGEWSLVSDHAIARFLCVGNVNGKERRRRLATKLVDATTNEGLSLAKPDSCAPNAPVEDVIPKLSDMPLLVIDGEHRLVGILTAFDLM